MVDVSEVSVSKSVECESVSEGVSEVVSAGEVSEGE